MEEGRSSLCRFPKYGVAVVRVMLHTRTQWVLECERQVSDDGGYTWTGSEPIVGAGSIQPSVVRKNDGSLVAYLRDNGPPPKRVHVSFSKDDGVTWALARDTD